MTTPRIRRRRIEAGLERVAGCHGFGEGFVDFVVLKPGAFWIRRALLERVLRSFDEKEIIILEADHSQMKIGRFSCSVRLWQAKPIPPERVELIPGTLRLSGGGG